MKVAIVVISLVLASLIIGAALKTGVAAQRTDAPEARVPGILNEGPQNSIEAPTAVQVGQEFEIKITTTGGGCERMGDTSWLLTESSATVLVYDFTSATRPGVACTMIFKQMPHTARLRFTKPGEAMIRVWGRRLGTDTPPGGVPTVLERRVSVK